MTYAPIVLFAYNRPDHLKITIDHLLKNKLVDQSDLFIFSDGAKNETSADSVSRVRNYLKTVTGFKSITIIKREKNFGLAENVIQGVSKILNQYPNVIVLEDDMITSPYFLEYMNNALTHYQNEERVISIHAYVNPVKDGFKNSFFLKGADCWGWATWKRGWDLFEPNGNKLLAELREKKLESEFSFQNTYNYMGMLKDQIAGKNNSWAIRWYASAFLQNKLTLYPSKSLVKNIGFDGSGTHSGKGSDFEVFLSPDEVKDFPSKIEASKEDFQKLCEFYASIRPGIFKRLFSKINQVFK